MKQHIHQLLIKGEYSEFYLKCSDFKKIMRYYPSTYEYELFTSDPAETQKQNRFLNYSKQMGWTLEQSIKAYARLKYEEDIFISSSI